MKTADLINALAAETTSEPRRMLSWRLAVWSGLGAVLALAIVLLVYGVRPDLSEAWRATALKSGFGLAAALVVLPILMRLSRPSVGIGAMVFVTFGFVALCVIAAVAHLASAQSFAPLGLAGGIPECLKRVPLLAIPIGALLFFVVRSFAPTRLTLAGAAIGAFSGGVAIIPYALFCPMDSIAYVATWYLSSILVCTALGAAIGGRVLRWT